MVDERPAPTVRERRVARLVAVIVAAWIALSLTARELVAEPWPAPLMPAFRGVPVAAGDEIVSTTGELTVVLADGSDQDLPVRALLNTSVAPQLVLRSTFFLGLDAEGHVIDMPRGRAAAFFLGQRPGWTLDGSHSIAHHPVTVAWLRERLPALVTAEPAALRIDWVRRRTDRSTGEITELEVVKTVIVDVT